MDFSFLQKMGFSRDDIGKIAEIVMITVTKIVAITKMITAT